MSEWSRYLLNDFEYTDFPAGSVVIDVGCGHGEQLRQLKHRGCTPIGIEPDVSLVEAGKAAGLDLRAGTAEAIPLPDGCAQGVVCKVALPYTDEKAAISEIARIMVPGAQLAACYHGAGYYLRYALLGPSLARRVYGVRSLFNTWWYAISGRRLPGWIGDTLYQSRARLGRAYRAQGLEVTEDLPAPKFAGAPVFIYQRVRRRMSDS